MTPEETDWKQIALLYQTLMQYTPTPVVALNHAVAVAMTEGPQAGLSLMESLSQLQGYLYLHAARGELLVRLGEHAQARVAYQRALDLSDSGAQQRFLRSKLESLSKHP